MQKQKAANPIPPTQSMKQPLSAEVHTPPYSMYIVFQALSSVLVSANCFYNVGVTHYRWSKKEGYFYLVTNSSLWSFDLETTAVMLFQN